MYGAIYPAVQNLCLAARGYGLGTSITGLHHISAKRLTRYSGSRPTYANEILVPMGYPKGRWGRPARKAAADVTFFEHWGRK